MVNRNTGVKLRLDIRMCFILLSLRDFLNSVVLRLEIANVTKDGGLDGEV